MKASHEVESKLGVRALGVLPITKSEPSAPLERMFSESNQNAFSEAIRTIRSSVLLSGLQSPHKVVLLTSSVPEEGKTTLATNLAFAFSQVKKTLLIEADMRRPKIAPHPRAGTQPPRPGRAGGGRACPSPSASTRCPIRSCTCCSPAACRRIRSS